MTPSTLNKVRDRLDAIERPAESTYIPKPLDADLAAAMRDYIAGRPIHLPGRSAAVLQAANDYLDEQRR